VALSKTIFIDRVNRATALAAFASAARTMQRDRQSVFIFPEGTRSYAETPELLPFKKGAFHLAVQAQVPVVPIVAANYADVLNVERRVFRGGVVPVKVLKPVETVGMGKEDVEELTRRVRESMLEALVELSGRERRVDGRGEVKKEL